MDYQAVGAPSNYGAPLVFQSGQQGQQQGQAQQQQNPVAAALAKAKQLLSSGQISAAQYSQLTSQISPQTELATSAGNMGAGMPGATGAPMNILPGVGG
jgi:hypothetical protein